jgi:hypothetical protein
VLAGWLTQARERLRQFELGLACARIYTHRRQQPPPPPPQLSSTAAAPPRGTSTAPSSRPSAASSSQRRRHPLDDAGAVGQPLHAPRWRPVCRPLPDVAGASLLLLLLLLLWWRARIGPAMPSR